MPGLYAVAVCVSEYRNGVLINTTRRDFLFSVLDCVIEIGSIVTPQTELATFINFCQGPTVEFENESFGATSYEWDFGVPGITTDVSNAFEPTYTYPGPGTYEVRLIASNGQGCTDTSYQTFIISESASAEFTAPPAQCITENSYDFVGNGDHPTGTTFLCGFWAVCNTKFIDRQGSGEYCIQRTWYFSSILQGFL